MAEDLPNLFWVPQNFSDSKITRVADIDDYYIDKRKTNAWIPCTFYKAAEADSHRNRLLLYFHANFCDLGDIDDELADIQRLLQCNVVGMEFPGYGLCSHMAKEPELIDRCARSVFEFLVLFVSSPAAITIMGRSIGTGPAAQLAIWARDRYGVSGGLILHSPYSSIRELAADYVHELVKPVLPDVWPTARALKEAKNIPLLIQHPRNDDIIPVSHSYKILADYDSDIVLMESSTEHNHNTYCISTDICTPTLTLWEKIDKIYHGMRDQTPVVDFIAVKPIVCKIYVEGFGREIREDNLHKAWFCGCSDPLGGLD